MTYFEIVYVIFFFSSFNPRLRQGRRVREAIGALQTERSSAIDCWPYGLSGGIRTTPLPSCTPPPPPVHSSELLGYLSTCPKHRSTDIWISWSGEVEAVRSETPHRVAVSVEPPRPGHRPEKPHLGRLYPRLESFGHIPRLIAIVEGRDRSARHLLSFASRLIPAWPDRGQLPQLGRSLANHAPCMPLCITYISCEEKFHGNAPF